jgi:hypothetical protein
MLLDKFLYNLYTNLYYINLKFNNNNNIFNNLSFNEKNKLFNLVLLYIILIFKKVYTVDNNFINYNINLNNLDDIVYSFFFKKVNTIVYFFIFLKIQILIV